MADKRDFKGIWIPKEVWEDPNLSALEKMILMEIDSLDNGEGCYASNKYLSEFCLCSERKVSEAVNKLACYHAIEVSYLKDNRRIIKSWLTYSRKCERVSQKLLEGIAETARGYSRNCDKEIIDENNREEIIDKDIYSTPRFRKPTIDEIRDYCNERGNDIDPEYFFNYYESVGWVVGGKKKMKDWKATVRYWESSRKKKAKTQSFEEMLRDL